jgi:predicted small secreted protein
MKRLLPCLMILLGVSLLGAGCATSSGGGQQSSSVTPTSPPGEVYTPAVAVPPSSP